MKSISAICTGFVLFAGVLGPLQAQTATYCREATISGELKSWPIIPFDPQTAASGEGLNYQIIADWVPAKDQIAAGDLIRISKLTAKTMELAHNDGDDVRKERLILTMDDSNLWAHGETTNGDQYVIYRLNDAAACQHDNVDEETSCKAFHFEYFLKDSTDDFPELNKNVKPMPDSGTCEGEAMQEDEGDGHNGPD